MTGLCGTETCPCSSEAEIRPPGCPWPVSVLADWVKVPNRPASGEFLRAVLKFSRMYFYSRINFFGRADPLCRPKMGGKYSPNFGYSRCQSAKFLRPTLKFSRMYFYSRINFFVPATPKICGFGRAGQRFFFLRFWAVGAIRRGQSVRRLECLLEVCYHLLVSSLVWIYGDLFLPSSEVYLHS